MAAPARAQAELCRLRREIARIEGRPAAAERLVAVAPTVRAASRAGEALWGTHQRGRLALGVGPLDAALGGGLRLDALHEVRAAETRDGGAAAGFVLALLARLAAGRPAPVLWVSTAEARREAGDLYAPGLALVGLDPGLLLHVAAERPAEALWAFEAGLSAPGLAAAVCEIRGAAALDLAATRRCALRAREAGVGGFLLRLCGRPGATAAETRWRVGSLPAAPVGGIVWRLDLEKSRGGRSGSFALTWNADERCFEPSDRAAAAASVAVAAAASDRPARPAGAILRRAS